MSKLTQSISFTAALPAIWLAFAPLAFSEEPRWTTDYAKAAEQAKAENKALLLDFTGSDWCGWCMKMKKETLDTPAFKNYAGKHLVLVEVDFPQRKPQTQEVKAQNQKLSQKYKVDGYPCFVILNPSGRELGRQGGYLEGGPTAFIAKIKKFYKAPERIADTGSGSFGSGDFDIFAKKPSPTP